MSRSLATQSTCLEMGPRFASSHFIRCLSGARAHTMMWSCYGATGRVYIGTSFAATSTFACADLATKPVELIIVHPHDSRHVCGLQRSSHIKNNWHPTPCVPKPTIRRFRTSVRHSDFQGVHHDEIHGWKQILGNMCHVNNWESRRSQVPTFLSLYFGLLPLT